MASTQVLWPLTAAAWLWANSLTGQTSTGSTAADRIAFTRLNTYALEVGEPGVGWSATARPGGLYGSTSATSTAPNGTPRFLTASPPLHRSISAAT